MDKTTWPALIQACYDKQIDLNASFATSKFDLQPYNVVGFSCAEIEVDMLTGTYILTRVDIMEDVGESLNPILDVGQVN